MAKYSNKRGFSNYLIICKFERIKSERKFPILEFLK